MSSISHLPPWLFGIIVVGTVIVLALIALSLFQRIIAGRFQLTEQSNVHVVFFSTVIAIFYSLTVGMIAVGVWNSYNGVASVVSAEATAIGCFYRDVTGYPEPARTRLQQHVRGYTEFIITKAWPAQLRGEPTDEATRRLTALDRELVGFEPTTVGQQLLHAETLRQYDEVAGLRRQRLHSIGSGLPSVMWSVVLIGGILTISITYLLTIDRALHILLTGFLAMFIGLVVFVIASLDKPLSGPLAIDSHPYQIVLDRLIDLK